MTSNHSKNSIVDCFMAGEKKLTSILNHTPLILWVLDRDGITLLSEGKGLAALGLKPGQVVGQSAFELYKDHPQIICNLRRALNGESFQDEVYVQGLWYETHFSPLYDEKSGEISGMAGLSFDITDNKNIMREFDKTIKIRHEFLSLAGHELKTPLTTLKLRLQLMERFTKKDPYSEGKMINEKLWGMIEDCQGQINNLTSLIEDMLDIDNLQKNDFRLMRERIDLVGMTEKILYQLSVQLEDVDCMVKILAPTSLVGHWDPDRLEQVIKGLILNAKKFGAGKDVQITIEKKGSRACFSIQDQGPGIDQQYHQMIFDCFTRIPSRENACGLGLGLYLAKQIILAHQGEISVESSLGKGTIFRVELPLESDSIQDEIPIGF